LWPEFGRTLGVGFNALFLVYVAVLGLSIYSLIGGLTAVDPVRVKAAFGQSVPVRSTWIVLIIVPLMFYIQWLSEDLPAILGGKTPQSLIDAGLPTSPVHVLDMAVLLPATLVSQTPWLHDRPDGDDAPSGEAGPREIPARRADLYRAVPCDADEEGLPLT
jgi:hypothetical protein